MRSIIKNTQIVNEGKIFQGDVLFENDIITKIDGQISANEAREFDGEGKYLIPGIIDDQVHFREPGLTHKANIATESKAAVAGGVTSFMEMPNTKPPALTQKKLEEKYIIGKNTSYANYSFFMGGSNDNYEEAMKTDGNRIPGLKLFMGSSTGNMLVDNRETLDRLFKDFPYLIATHCEDEATIRGNVKKFKSILGDTANATYHDQIRNVEGCYLSSSMAVELAKKHNTRLHILHISTAKEVDLFRNDIPLKEKRITSEVCVHHLSFDNSQYIDLGNRIKCNPAIKHLSDQRRLWEGMLDNHLDIIATDHAPHTKEEKAQHYWNAPSGLPLIQHTLNMMLNHFHSGRITLERIIEKMCHAPAACFQISKRGYIREGYKADLVLVDVDQPWTVLPKNILYKCGWSPLEGEQMKGMVEKTFVNGNLIYNLGKFNEDIKGERIIYERY
ncbi:MAG: dihydroorotase [Saprospiraceae bacterium]|nr:dihydroorotase [Saprospiraceae bacterium]